MLKIKDNVDLKELEKFGLKYHKEDDLEIYTSSINNWHSIDVDVKTRHISVHDDLDFGQQAVVIFYKLVIAGVVEYVEN